MRSLWRAALSPSHRSQGLLLFVVLSTGTAVVLHQPGPGPMASPLLREDCAYAACYWCVPTPLAGRAGLHLCTCMPYPALHCSEENVYKLVQTLVEQGRAAADLLVCFISNGMKQARSRRTPQWVHGRMGACMVACTHAFIWVWKQSSAAHAGDWRACVCRLKAGANLLPNGWAGRFGASCVGLPRHPHPGTVCHAAHVCALAAPCITTCGLLSSSAADAAT